jgi:hypothetical protein
MESQESRKWCATLCIGAIDGMGTQKIARPRGGPSSGDEQTINDAKAVGGSPGHSSSHNVPLRPGKGAGRPGGGGTHVSV